MKIVKKVITVFVTIILLLVLSFNIFNTISIKLLGNRLPTINGYAYLEVISGSMEPKISKGDIVIIDTKVSDYRVNDIVTFRDINDSFVTHRIIEINKNEIITKGDANNTIDDPINKDDIVGRYVYQINGIGALIKSLRSPFVLVMILVVGILLCVFVSTDSKGNAILTEEEKEYMEFLASKNGKSSDKTKNNKTTTSKETTTKNTTKSVKAKTPIKKEDKKITKTTNNKVSDIKNTKTNNKTTKKTVKQTPKSDKTSSKTKTTKIVKTTKAADNKENTKTVKTPTKKKAETKKVEKTIDKTAKPTKVTSNKNTKQSSKTVKTKVKKKEENTKTKPTVKTTKKTTKK